MRIFIAFAELKIQFINLFSFLYIYSLIMYSQYVGGIIWKSISDIFDDRIRMFEILFLFNYIKNKMKNYFKQISKK